MAFYKIMKYITYSILPLMLIGCAPSIAYFNKHSESYNNYYKSIICESEDGAYYTVQGPGFVHYPEIATRAVKLKYPDLDLKRMTPATIMKACSLAKLGTDKEIIVLWFKLDKEKINENVRVEMDKGGNVTSITKSSAW